MINRQLTHRCRICENIIGIAASDAIFTVLDVVILRSGEVRRRDALCQGRGTELVLD